MAIHVRAQERDSVARFLGWFSIALGTAELTAPRALCKLVGASGEGLSKTLMRAMGVRELGHGVAILTRPRPLVGVASRVVGDAIDLSLLTLNAMRNPEGRRRTAFAMANVLAVAVPDVAETIDLTKKAPPPQSGKQIIKAVTIIRPRDEVEAAWVAAEDVRRKVDNAHGSVRFAEAPGNRGTELSVSFYYDPPLGDLGAVATKLTGHDLATELSDDLRRIKQIVETGEVVRSDATPTGHLLPTHLRQRPAQPLARPVEEALR